MIAQAEAVDGEALALDRERARHVHVLLEVGAREALLVVLVGLLVGFAAVERPDRLVDQVEGHLLLRVVFEGLLRIGHGARLGELHHRAVERGAVPLGRLLDLEAEARRVEGVVVRDLRAPEGEQDAAVGEIEADRALGVALVRAVPDPEPAAELLPRDRRSCSRRSR